MITRFYGSGSNILAIRSSQSDLHVTGVGLISQIISYYLCRERITFSAQIIWTGNYFICLIYSATSCSLQCLAQECFLKYFKCDGSFKCKIQFEIVSDSLTFPTIDLSNETYFLHSIFCLCCCKIQKSCLPLLLYPSSQTFRGCLYNIKILSLDSKVMGKHARIVIEA